MKKSTSPSDASRLGIRLVGLVLLGCLLLALLALLRPRAAHDDSMADRSDSANAKAAASSQAKPSPRVFKAGPAHSAEEIVAAKLAQFATEHEALVAAMAKHFGVAVPPEAQRFFAAVQAGDWQETTNLFAALKELRESATAPPGFQKLWPALLETYGVAEQAHNWPAQQLLDYGNAVLDALPPDMVYIGGTDAGRFIPTLLADTSGGEPRIVLTQNALADADYLQYFQFRYGDRLNALTFDDSLNGFNTYLADARKRFQHDQDFPNDPAQLRPGENIQITDGRVQVGGQVAVMAINEQLLQILLQKNPDLRFALEESAPLSSFYDSANLLGPVTELRATDASLTPERAAQAVDYWRATTESLLAESSAAPRDAYAKLILGQAHLLLDHYPAEAEQALQLGLQLSPAHPETVSTYAALLFAGNRGAEARQLLQNAVQAAPDNSTFRALLNQALQMP